MTKPKKHAEKPKFEGVLAEPMPTHKFLFPVSDSERNRMLIERVIALFRRYQIKPADPENGIVADDWARLTMALADEFIPGFRDREPWEEERGPGAPPKRTETDWLEFLADVFEYQKQTGLREISLAVARVANRDPWKGRGFNYARCNEFKRGSKLWKMVPMAAAGESHETGTEVSVEDFVINLYGRKSDR